MHPTPRTRERNDDLELAKRLLQLLATTNVLAKVDAGKGNVVALSAVKGTTRE